jgi:hypothetical protein
MSKIERALRRVQEQQSVQTTRKTVSGRSLQRTGTRKTAVDTLRRDQRKRGLLANWLYRIKLVFSKEDSRGEIPKAPSTNAGPPGSLTQTQQAQGATKICYPTPKRVLDAAIPKSPPAGELTGSGRSTMDTSGQAEKTESLGNLDVEDIEALIFIGPEKG